VIPPTCAEIAAEIERGVDFLTTNVRNTPERHRSILAVCQQSWQRLTPQEQTVFANFAVFRGGFRRTAAETVAVRQFSHYQAQRADLQAAHARYYLRFLQERLPAMLGGRQHEAWAEIHAIIPVIAQSLRFRRNNGAMHSLQPGGALFHFGVQQSRLQQEQVSVVGPGIQTDARAFLCLAPGKCWAIGLRM
jgi:predicted ATPase